jgi:hypothetical protein
MVLAGLAVLVVSTALLIRRADATTLIRVARHALWLSATVVAAPGLLWAVLAFSSAVTLRGLWGAAAAAFAVLPLFTSFVSSACTRFVLALCVIVSAAGVVMAAWLPLLLPITLPLTVIWLIALRLVRAARRIHMRPSAEPSIPR